MKDDMNKICEKCNKFPAEVKLIIYEAGKKKVLNLCKLCAEEESLGVSSSAASPPVPKKEAPLLKPEEDLVCANCGYKLSEFLKISKFKCEKCYEAFEPNTMKIISEYHKAEEHRGKIYTGAYTENKEFKLKVLRRALDEAIRREEYERAARLRDLINEVEGKNDA
jgi:protein arginine kinase activator